MIRTQIRLSEEQARAVRRIAAARRISVAELIRRAVDDWVRATITVDPDDQRRRAIAAAGRFSSGQRDVARRHDRYLARAYRR
jgi:predicted transcriptional regulator